MTTTIDAPRLMGGRDQVAELFADIADDLTDVEVIVHFQTAAMSTPSFVDELVRIALTERQVRILTLANVSERVCQLATDAAAHFGVVDRLDCLLAD